MGEAVERLIALAMVPAHKTVTKTGKVVNVKPYQTSVVKKTVDAVKDTEVGKFGMRYSGIATSPPVKRAQNHDFSKVPITDAPTSGLEASEERVSGAKVKEVASGKAGDRGPDYVPHILKMRDGTHVIIDGHTRTAAHVTNGKKTMKAKIITQDEMDSQPQSRKTSESHDFGRSKKMTHQLSHGPAVEALLSLANVGDYTKLVRGKVVHVAGYATKDWVKGGDKIKATAIQPGHVFQHKGKKYFALTKAKHVPPAPFEIGHYKDSGLHHVIASSVDANGERGNDRIALDIPSDAVVHLEPGTAKGRTFEAQVLGTKRRKQVKKHQDAHMKIKDSLWEKRAALYGNAAPQGH